MSRSLRDDPVRNAAARARPVDWYAPRQLARTGFQVAISTLFAKHADARAIEAITPAHAPPLFDHSRPAAVSPDDALPVDENGAIWIDYVADSGDGFDATYAVASFLAMPEIVVERSKELHATRRGSVLLFGGDQVYPCASRSEYARRLVRPYEAAAPEDADQNRFAYAIPGNHDWYDGHRSYGNSAAIVDSRRGGPSSRGATSR